jgi:hypothetical protein
VTDDDNLRSRYHRFAWTVMDIFYRDGLSV